MQKTLIIHPEELSIDQIDTMCNIGCDGIGIHPVGGADSYKSLTDMLNLFNDTDFTKNIDYAKSKGLDIEYEMHTARYLLPENIFEKHPEYFRVNKNGERTCDFNFCVSCEDALKIVEQNALKLAKSLYKTCNKLYFWLDDSKDAFCHCEKCKNISPCDQQMIVLNRMIKYIKKQIPDCKMAYLAYYETLDVPSVKPEDGIFVEFAPYERDFSQPAEMMDSQNKIKLKKLIDYFGKSDSKILEYWYDNSLFSDYKKPPKQLVTNNKMILKDFEFYKSFGVENISSFACYLGEDYVKLYPKPDFSAFGKL